MSASTPVGVSVPFPLPLTPFERYFIADDCPQYPTCIPAELLFSGRLDQQAFREALRGIVARHPLLNALVEDGPHGPRWIARDAPEAWLDWADDSRPIGHPQGEYLDLRREPGFRVWVRVGADTSRVVMQYHHACCDGLAVLQIVGDLMVLYAAALGAAESVPRLPPLSVERLRDRGLFDAGVSPIPWPATTVRDLFLTSSLWLQIFFRRCRVLAGAERRREEHAADRVGFEPPRDETGAENSGDFLAFETRVLGRAESQRLKDAAAARGATLNDLLMRDMLLVARDWNRARGDASVGPIRIAMPVYVRGRLGRDIPASNGIGYAFVTVDPDKYTDADALLNAVHARTRAIKKWRLALHFLGGLAMALRSPRLVRWVLKRENPLATVVVSYLGPAVTHVPLARREGKLISGNVVLEQMAGTPPVRPQTRASVVVLEYAGELAIALRTDARHFRAEDTRTLVDAYVARLRATIDSA